MQQTSSHTSVLHTSWEAAASTSLFIVIVFCAAFTLTIITYADEYDCQCLLLVMQDPFECQLLPGKLATNLIPAQVIHQPLAVVYHQEGSTLGTDSSKAKQLLMNTNRRIFHKKWAAELRARHCAK